ncbi:hypothetical protein CR513_19814, partial [Mucuna pruriens]
MTRERSNLRPILGIWITYGGNKKGRIVGIGIIDKHIFSSIDNVLYVEGLKHNLVSISQLCGSGYDVSFNKGECVVKNTNSSLSDKINLTKSKCNMFSDHWIWHKKLGHASLRLISKLNKHHLIRRFLDIIYSMMHDKKGDKLKDHLSARTLFQLLHLSNYYILICLVQ